MSRSKLYILNKKSVTFYADFHSGWGSAMRCWDYLGQKYIEKNPVYSLDEKHLQKVWDLADDNRLSESERICLLMTFDKMYIPLDCLNDAADACIEFGRSCRDSHWPYFGLTLKTLSQHKFNRHARGIALACTSVNDCWVNMESNDWIKNAWPIYD